jgi:hypothetical protein
MYLDCVCTHLVLIDADLCHKLGTVDLKEIYRLSNRLFKLLEGTILDLKGCNKDYGYRHIFFLLNLCPHKGADILETLTEGKTFCDR